MEDWTHKHHRQGLFNSNAIAKTFKSWRHQRVRWESQSSSNIVRVRVWIESVMDSNDFSPWIFCTQSLQCLLDPSNSCRRHSEVLTRFLGLWSPKKRFGLWRFSGQSAPFCHVTKATKQWRIPAFQLPYQKLEVPESCSTLHQLIMVAWCLQKAKDRVVVCKIGRYWLWSRLSHIWDCCKSMKKCRDSACRLRGLEAGLPAFRLLEFQGSTPCQKLQVPWERQHAPPALHYCIMPLPSLELVKNTCLTQRISRGSRQGVVVCRICYVHYSDCVKDLDYRAGYWLRSQLWHMTAASQWRIVEIEFLAMAGWRWDCQPFSCPCLLNVTRCRKEICWTCLSKEFIPALLGIPSIHSLPEASGPWEPQYPPPVLNYCIMPIPLLLQEKPVSCKELNNCRDWAFSNSGLEVGLPAFRLPMFEARFCGNLSFHSARSLRSLRAAARSTTSLWSHHACKR